VRGSRIQFQPRPGRNSVMLMINFRFSLEAWGNGQHGKGVGETAQVAPRRGAARAVQEEGGVVKQRVLLTRGQYRHWSMNQQWDKFLSIHFPERVDAVRLCGDRWASYSDSNGHLIRKPLKCRERDICPSDANQYRQFLVNDAISEIGRVYNKLRMVVRFASGEFTLHPHVQEVITEADFPMLRKMAIEVINSVFSDGGRYQLAGEVSVHFWSSSAPFSGWNPHVHFTLLDLALIRSEGRFVRLQMHMTQEKIHELRMAWLEAVNKKFGTDYKETDVHYHYSKGLGHLNHRLSYSFRSPIVDFYKLVTSAVYPVETRADWVQRALARGGSKKKRFVWFGWLQDRNRSRSFALIDIEWQKKSERDRERKRVICPLCGQDMHLISTDDRWDDFADVTDPCILGWRETGGGLDGRF